MRRLAALALTSLAIALAGCGGGESSSPLDDALGYLPDSSPLAVVIETDPRGEQVSAGRSLLRKFPFGDQLLGQLDQTLREEGAELQRDVLPLLGNELVVGSPDARNLAADGEQFVAAIVTADEGTLNDLVGRATDDRRLTRVGESSGATIYLTRSGDPVAVKDAVLLFADSRGTIDEALKQRDADSRLTEDKLDEALTDLPGDAILRVYSDVEALLQTSTGAREARRIPWVGALRTLGATGALSPDAVTIDFGLATDSESLTENELPLAPGSESPPVLPLGRGQDAVSGGLRDLTHLFRFGEGAGKAVDPAGFSQYAAGKRQVSGVLDIDLDRDVIDQLKGDTAVLYDLDGEITARTSLDDPSAFAGALKKLRPVVPGFMEGLGLEDVRVTAPRGGDDLYTLTSAGERIAVYGVIDDKFVAATDPRSAARTAAGGGQPVSDAQGPLAAKADAEALASTLLADGIGGFGGVGAALLTRPLEEIDLWLANSTSQLRGRIQLAVE